MDMVASIFNPKKRWGRWEVGTKAPEAHGPPNFIYEAEKKEPGFNKVKCEDRE